MSRSWYSIATQNENAKSFSIYLSHWLFDSLILSLYTHAHPKRRFVRKNIPKQGNTLHHQHQLWWAGNGKRSGRTEPSFDWEYVYLGKIGFGWPIKNEQTVFLFFSSCSSSSSFSGEINIKSGFLWYPECIKRKKQRVGIGFGLLCWLLHQAAIYNDFGDQRLEVMPSPHLARHQAQQDLSTEIENFSTANTHTRN